MEIAVPLQNLSQTGLSKNFKDSLFLSPQYSKNCLNE